MPAKRYDKDACFSFRHAEISSQMVPSIKVWQKISQDACLPIMMRNSLEAAAAAEKKGINGSSVIFLARKKTKSTIRDAVAPAGILRALRLSSLSVNKMGRAVSQVGNGGLAILISPFIVGSSQLFSSTISRAVTIFRTSIISRLRAPLLAKIVKQRMRLNAP